MSISLSVILDFSLDCDFLKIIEFYLGKKIFDSTNIEEAGVASEHTKYNFKLIYFVR